MLTIIRTEPTGSRGEMLERLPCNFGALRQRSRSRVARQANVRLGIEDSIGPVVAAIINLRNKIDRLSTWLSSSANLAHQFKTMEEAIARAANPSASEPGSQGPPGQLRGVGTNTQRTTAPRRADNIYRPF